MRKTKHINMKANVLIRRRGPQVAPYRTPEQRVGNLTGSIATKVKFGEVVRKPGRIEETSRAVYATNSTWRRDRQHAQKFLQPLERSEKRRDDGSRKNHPAKVNQLFYWGHERYPPPKSKVPQFPPSKVIPKPTNDLNGLAETPTQQLQKSSHQGSSCPTQIYSKFKALHSEKMKLVPNVNINGPVQADLYARKRHRLQPLRLGYTPDETAAEDFGPSSSKRELTQRSAGHHNTYWQRTVDIEERKRVGWSPLEQRFDPMPNEWVNTDTRLDEFDDHVDFIRIPVAPPTTPSEEIPLDSIDPPPNTPYDF